MFGLWNRLFCPGALRGTPEADERIGESKLAWKCGEDILKENPHRKALVGKIRDRMVYLTREELPELVDRMLARFALYVVDLPASERDHHSGPFGLLDHSLEVASETAAGLAGSSFRISPDPLVDYKERPTWVYAGMLAALGHDLGKVFDIQVLVQGNAWEPTREPLGAFLDRKGLSRSGPPTWSFRAGRGLDGNENRNAEILELILPPAARAYLGPCLGWIGKLYVSRTQDTIEKALPEAARKIKDLIGVIDRHTSVEDAWKRKAKPAHAVRKDADTARKPVTSPSETGQDTHQPSTAAPGQPGSKAPPPASLPPLPPTPSLPASSPASQAAGEAPAPKRDPTEARRLIDHSLEPVNFLDSVRRMIQGCTLPANGKFTESFVTQEHTWIIVPRGLELLARFMHLRWNEDTERRMMASLETCPQVERNADGGVLWRIQPHPKDTFHSAIALRTLGLLSRADLERLKEWHFRIVARSWKSKQDEFAESSLAS